MATATATFAASTFPGFADKSPAELREILLPEDHEAFDAAWQRTVDRMQETLSLQPLREFLDHWRRYTWSQQDMGPERWRAMLARADYINFHRKAPPGTVTHSADEIRELIDRRLAAQA